MEDQKEAFQRPTCSMIHDISFVHWSRMEKGVSPIQLALFITLL